MIAAITLGIAAGTAVIAATGVPKLDDGTVSTLMKVALVSLAVVGCIGVILGLSGVAVFYDDFADLTRSFSAFMLAVLGLFYWGSVVGWLTLAAGLVCTVMTLVAAHRVNGGNWFITVFVGIAKIALGAVFIAALCSFLDEHKKGSDDARTTYAELVVIFVTADLAAAPLARCRFEVAQMPSGPLQLLLTPQAANARP